MLFLEIMMPYWANFDFLKGVEKKLLGKVSIVPSRDDSAADYPRIRQGTRSRVFFRFSYLLSKESLKTRPELSFLAVSGEQRPI